MTTVLCHNCISGFRQQMEDLLVHQRKNGLDKEYAKDIHVGFILSTHREFLSPQNIFSSQNSGYKFLC